MKKILLIATATVALLLSACSSTPRTELDGDYKMEGVLEGCQVAKATDDDYDTITVVRCPNSTTTTKSGGKVKRTVVVIDGVKYEQVKE